MPETKSGKAGKGRASSLAGSYPVEFQILAAKRLGFTVGEIRRLTVGEVLTFAALSAPDEEEGNDAPRAATQADIDAFLR